MADLKGLTRRIYTDAFENGNVDVLDELAREDVIEHEPPPPGIDAKPGREGVKQTIAALHNAFDPLKIEVHEMYQDGDTVIARVTFSGTHSGDFGGIPATGKSFSAETIDILRFENGRVAEHWGRMDDMGMMMQLGIAPPMD